MPTMACGPPVGGDSAIQLELPVSLPMVISAYALASEVFLPTDRISQCNPHSIDHLKVTWSA